MCVPDCLDCDDPPIQLQMMAVPAGIPSATALAKLTAYDKNGRVLHDATFVISDSQVGLANSMFHLLPQRKLFQRE